MKKEIIIKITVFMVLTLAFSIILALLQELLAIDYRYLTLPQWGPGIAALILSVTLYKKALFQGNDLKQLPLIRLLLCVVLPIGLMGLSFLISQMFDLISENSIQIEFSILYLVIPGSLFGALGEALGWRKFLQSSLNKVFYHVQSSIIVGVLWGLWHIGNYSNGPIYMGLFLIFTISASLMLSLLIRQYHYNVLIATLFHLSINMGFYIFFRAYLSDISMMFVNALIWVIAATAMTVFFSKREDPNASIDSSVRR